jgi:hypothetical protein
MPGDTPLCQKHLHLFVINTAAYRRFQTRVSKGLLSTNVEMRNAKSSLVIINSVLKLT